MIVVAKQALLEKLNLNVMNPDNQHQESRPITHSPIFGEEDEHPLELLGSLCDEEGWKTEIFRPRQGNLILHLSPDQEGLPFDPRLEVFLLDEIAFPEGSPSRLSYLQISMAYPNALEDSLWSEVVILLNRVNTMLPFGMFSLSRNDEMPGGSGSDSLVCYRYCWAFPRSSFRTDVAFEVIELCSDVITRYHPVMAALGSGLPLEFVTKIVEGIAGSLPGVPPALQ
jgi:hypothetical protein